MSEYSEDDLIEPSLKIISENQFGISTSDLILRLREVLKPSGEDLSKLVNRNDDKFSQKVRNLRSHKTLESKGYVTIKDGNFYITKAGKEFIFSNKFNEQISEKDKKILLFLDTNIEKKDLDEKIFIRLNEYYIFKYIDLIQNFHTLTKIPHFGKVSLVKVENFLKQKNIYKNDFQKYVELYHDGSSSNLDITSNTNQFDLNKYLILFVENKILFTNEVRLLNICSKYKYRFFYELLLNYNQLSQIAGLGKKSISKIDEIILNENHIFSDLLQIIENTNLDEFIDLNKNKIQQKINNKFIKSSNIDDFIEDKLDIFNLKASNKDRNSNIIFHRYGLCNRKFLTLESLGKFYGITRERIRQISQNFIKLLKTDGLIEVQLSKLIDEINSNKICDLNYFQKIILSKYFSKNVDPKGLIYLLNAFKKDSFLIDELFIDNNRKFLFSSQETFRNIEKSFEFLRKIHKKNDSYKDIYNNQYKKLSVFKKNYLKYFNRNLDFIKFLQSFDRIIIDEQSDRISIHKNDHYINGKIRKLRNIIDDKLPLNVLYEQINRDWRRHVPSIKILKEHLKRSNYKYDDDYLYFSDIELISTALSDLEIELINLINDNDGYIYLEQIQEIKFEYDNFLSSSPTVYLKYNSLFKEIAKSIYSLCSTSFSRVEVNDIVEKRKNYLKKFKSNMESSWDQGLYSISFILSSYTSSSLKFYVSDSINEIIQETYEYIHNSNTKLNIFNRVAWFTDKSFFNNHKIAAGDKITFKFDNENHTFDLIKNK